MDIHLQSTGRSTFRIVIKQQPICKFIPGHQQCSRCTPPEVPLLPTGESAINREAAPTGICGIPQNHENCRNKETVPTEILVEMSPRTKKREPRRSNRVLQKKETAMPEIPFQEWGQLGKTGVHATQRKKREDHFQLNIAIEMIKMGNSLKKVAECMPIAYVKHYRGLESMKK